MRTLIISILLFCIIMIILYIIITHNFAWFPAILLLAFVLSLYLKDNNNSNYRF